MIKKLIFEHAIFNTQLLLLLLLSKLSKMTPEEKINLITRNLKEVVGLDHLRKIVATRPLKIHFGTAPTGRIHIGYFVPVLKIVDFLKAGCEVKILIADLHAQLDNLKSNSDLVKHRTSYYQQMIELMLNRMGAPMENCKFCFGSDYQLSVPYTLDVYKLCTMLTLNDAKRAGAEVVKQSGNPVLGSLIYPILQALDEVYLDVDCQFGGLDQRKIFMMARNFLPILGYQKKIHLMAPMLPSMTVTPPKPKVADMDNESSGSSNDVSETISKVSVDIMETDVETIEINKMSASDPKSKIDLLDGKKMIRKKINQMYCLEGDLTFNPVMDLVRMIIFPLMEHMNISVFTINRPEKYGGPIHFDHIDKLTEAFANKELHPADLKNSTGDFLNIFLEPIRQEFSSREKQNLLKQAYPE